MMARMVYIDKMIKHYLFTPTIILRFYSLIFVLLLISTCKADNAFDYEPSVSVTSDLDEPQQLGFCIDIYGSGSSMECDNMQTNSCKESGDDAQFEYHSPTKSLRAVNYDANCDQISASSTESRGCIKVNDDNIVDGATLGLDECDESMDSQIFTAVESNGNFELHIGANFCLVVSDTTRPAGPGVARDLMISTCDSVPEELKTWTIRPNPLTEGENEDEQSPTPSPIDDVQPHFFEL